MVQKESNIWGDYEMHYLHFSSSSLLSLLPFSPFFPDTLLSLLFLLPVPLNNDGLKVKIKSNVFN